MGMLGILGSACIGHPMSKALTIAPTWIWLDSPLPVPSMGSALNKSMKG